MAASYRSEVCIVTRFLSVLAQRILPQAGVSAGWLGPQADTLPVWSFLLSLFCTLLATAAVAWLAHPGYLRLLEARYSGTIPVSRRTALLAGIACGLLGFLPLAIDILPPDRILRIGGLAGLPALSLLLLLLATLVVTDLSIRTIPNRVLLLCLAPVAILHLSGLEPVTAGQHLLGGVLGFAAFGIGALASHGEIGGGDVKLMGLVGLAVGPAGLLAVLVFLAIGLLSTLALRALLHRPVRRVRVPMAPYLAGGLIVSLGSLLLHA